MDIKEIEEMKKQLDKFVKDFNKLYNEVKELKTFKAKMQSIMENINEEVDQADI